MTSLTLYSYYRSSCSYRARIGLHLKNISFHYQAVHLLKEGGEQFHKDFQEMNPFSQVPCLKHGEKVLNQSLPILLYLEELQPEPALLPKNSFQRAEILSFCEMINSGIQPLQNLSVLKYVETEMQSDKKAWAKHWIQKGLFICETFLKPRAKSFSFGETPGLADCFLIPQIYNAKRFDINMKEFPTLERVNESSLSVPAFQKALPENQPDAPL